MTDFQPPGALRRNPEIAQRIAYLIGHYSTLEYHLFLIYAAIATLHVPSLTWPPIIELCFSTFYEQRSANRKTGLILQEAKPRIDALRYQAVVKVCRLFKGAAKRRTDVAHCVFMGRDVGKVWRLSTAKKKPTFEVLDQRYFDRTTLQFQTLGRDIAYLLGFLVMTKERHFELVRALPLPPDIPFPAEALAHQAPPDPRAIDQLKSSLSRLGLLPLLRD